jgi:hypothetical protein
MDKHPSSENISSWIRAASAAIGVLLFSVYVLWNSENEKSSTLTQETKTKEMRNLENPSPDQAESERKLTVEIQKLQYRH